MRLALRVCSLEALLWLVYQRFHLVCKSILEEAENSSIDWWSIPEEAVILRDMCLLLHMHMLSSHGQVVSQLQPECIAVLHNRQLGIGVLCVCMHIMCVVLCCSVVAYLPNMLHDYIGIQITPTKGTFEGSTVPLVAVVVPVALILLLLAIGIVIVILVLVLRGSGE